MSQDPGTVPDQVRVNIRWAGLPALPWGDPRTLKQQLPKEVLQMRLKWLPMVCLALCLALVASPALASAKKAADRMTIDELKKILDDPELVIIDVRTGSDWKTSSDKIKGAVREEYKQVETWSSDYDKAKTIVLYCS